MRNMCIRTIEYELEARLTARRYDRESDNAVDFPGLAAGDTIEVTLKGQVFLKGKLYVD
jgi:hypothetical protein